MILIIEFKFNTIHNSDPLVIYCTAELHPLSHLFFIITFCVSNLYIKYTIGIGKDQIRRYSLLSGNYM